ncbi:NAD(P)-dependent oxidoreductase [Clostridium sp.]|uniref:NAD-dependent epimerase/dehydratase family protein n=1 Tax=Clostridium sp. TaxID=1506 RepID=UPI0025BCD20A|nr:GDP-mannose 4,6-dehydratase [Clostridium sp.]
MGLTALVTGGTGFIGSNLIKELLEKNWIVYALVRKNSSLGYKRLKGVKNIKYIYVEELFKHNYKELDEVALDNEDIAKTLPQFDICFHLAAYGVDYRQQNVNELIDGNIKFTLDVLNFCKDNKTKKVINTGSCFEYGLNEGKKINEEDKLNPHSLYGSAKASSVIMANAYSEKNNIPLVTVRPFGIFGENEGLHKFVPQLMKAVILNENMEMTSGEQVRDYLYIKDLAEAYIAIALTDLPLYEAYNVCSGEEVKIKDLAIKVAEIANDSLKSFNLGAVPYRKNEVMHFVGDNSKIKKYTKWEPKYNLQQGLKRTYEWYKVNWRKYNESV